MGMLEGKVAVITGGTSGIGASTAASARFIRVDVSIEREVAARMQLAVDSFGRLDCLFNNAGEVTPRDGITTIDLERFNAALAVHLGGALLGMKYAAPIMMRQQSGSIISMASVNGSRAGYTSPTGATAKAAVIHLTKAAAVELGPYGVRVNTISPGPVLTGIFGKGLGFDHDAADREPEVVRSALEDFVSKIQPLRGVATPRDIAQVALFLASDASRFVTAHDLLVDGGIAAGRTQAEMVAVAARFREVSAPPN